MTQTINAVKSTASNATFVPNLMATPLAPKVTIEDHTFEFPMLYRVTERIEEAQLQEILKDEYETHMENGVGNLDIITSYRLGSPDIASIPDFLELVESVRITRLDPVYDSGRWIILRRHFSLIEARAYVKALLDIYDYAENIIDASAQEVDEGVFSIVVMHARNSGPDTAIIYKAEIEADLEIDLLTAAFGPGGEPLDLDDLFPSTAQ